MVLRKRGSVYIVGLMIAVLLIFFALAIAGPMHDVINETRTSWDCSNSSISDYDKGGCLLADLTAPYFLGIVLVAAGTILAAKVINVI